VSRPDVVVALSQAGYDRFGRDVADGGVVLVDETLVEAEDVRSVPFTLTAEEVGRKIVANIVMVGYIGALIDVVPHDVIESTVLDNIPAGTEDLNRKAVRAGRDLWLGSEGGHDGS
jgi:2-oxoglutarate ferredoxin oxidoreductase subunit gamma